MYILMIFVPYKSISIWKQRDMGIDQSVPMMTSSNGNIYRITGPLCGGFTGDRGLNKRLSKQLRRWLFWNAIAVIMTSL